MKASVERIKFGKRIRLLRGKIGISQEELGFKAGLHRTCIGSIERGEQNVSMDNIIKLAKAFKIPLAEAKKIRHLSGDIG
jgi:transcriptional regulator with XRE-family HTH domain